MRVHKRHHHDPDGIERRVSKITGDVQEFCRTRAARDRRRSEIWEAAGRRCECRRCSCRTPLMLKMMHWHHKKHRSLGGDDSLANGAALCAHCHLVCEHDQF